ncbi:hypothetical protein [Nostoc sp.]|uniref:hypothetical protein n=1 Tax=Nostoc sp. TaxID=1180 RepID=UPI002FF616CF
MNKIEDNNSLFTEISSEEAVSLAGGFVFTGFAKKMAEILWMRQNGYKYDPRSNRYYFDKRYMA